MPHDINGKKLHVGDRVALYGTIKNITSEQPTFCNITFVADKGMEPTQDTEGYTLALSARMVELVQSTQSPGQIAYNAYCETRGWQSFNKEPLPQWEQVQPDIQESWEAAAKAITASIFPITLHSAE